MRPHISIKSQPFALLGNSPETAKLRGKNAIWQTAVKSENYHLDAVFTKESNQSFPSGWHVTEGDLICWRLISDQLICARIDGHLLGEALIKRLPIQGMDAYLGRLTLTTLSSIPLHEWGTKRFGLQSIPVAWKRCSAPPSLNGS